MNIIDTVERGLIKSGGEVFSIGNSVCGNPILCAKKGSGGKKLIVTAAIHARECYSALVALRAAAEFTEGGTAYFIPLINPDGAMFFESGETFGHPFLMQNADRRYEWKANADGVDLNTNFDANWGGGRSNKLMPAPGDFIGNYPLCAPESAALWRFTLEVRPSATISYHCMGGELYWEYGQGKSRRRRDIGFATEIAEHIGVKRVDGHLFSAGGYKDACISILRIPAVTVELIHSGEHPFFAADYERDARLNADIASFALARL